MLRDPIAAQIELLKLQQKWSMKAGKDLAHESPLARTRIEIKKQLESADQYRMSVLKGVNTFACLSFADLLTAAQNMEEVFYIKGDIIIEQDDIGDSFYVLESGRVSVTRKASAHDKGEAPKEISQLGPNSYFGEIALITEEPRSATVTVISETAKCLRMTKSRFESVVSVTKKLMAESRSIIGKDVIDKVPLFKSLNAITRSKLLEAMQSVTFSAGSYICRQGTVGNTFYIITDGSCRVTLNTDSFAEKEVNTMFAGDFFGEVALIEASSKRTANVIAMESVSCMTLSKTDFDFLLKNLKSAMIQNHQLRHINDERALSGKVGGRIDTAHPKGSERADKRRISGFDERSHRSEQRVANLLKRMGKFMFESLYDSLYSRLYKEVLLSEVKALEYGDIVTRILQQTNNRNEALQIIREETRRILEMEPSARSAPDNSFIGGLMRQRNMLHEKLCHNWPAYQFNDICKKLRFIRVKAMRRIIEIGSRGSCAFLILRGCVRIFTAVRREEFSDTAARKLLHFEEDLYPGEYFGEAVLNGIRTRTITAQALTACDLAVFEDDDFLAAQDTSIKMSMEQRLQFLSCVAPFKQWEKYRLYRIAHALEQVEFERGHVILSHGCTTKCVYFLLYGRVDVVPSLDQQSSPITTLQKYESLGEAGFINSRNRVMKKVHEEFVTVCVTRSGLLFLPESAFNLIEEHTADMVYAAFVAKSSWRQKRYYEVRQERKRLKHLKTTIARASLVAHERKLGLRGSLGVMGGSLSFMESTTSPMGASTIITTRSPRRALSPLTDGVAAQSSRLLVEPSLMFASMDLSGRRLQPLSAQSVLEDSLVLPPATDSLTVKASPQVVTAALASHGLSDPNGRLADIEDIPIILDRDFDPFMIVHSCRSEKERNRLQVQLTHIRRPKVARTKTRSASELTEAGFRSSTTGLRPVTSYGSSRLPKEIQLYVHNPVKVLSDNPSNSIATKSMEEIEQEMKLALAAIGDAQAPSPKTRMTALHDNPSQVSKSSIIRTAPAPSRGVSPKVNLEPRSSRPSSPTVDLEMENVLDSAVKADVDDGDDVDERPRVRVSPMEAIGLFGSGRLPQSMSISNLRK